MNTMSLLYHIHRYFGVIRHFKHLDKHLFIYVQAIPGHNKETIQISYTPNGLLCIEGDMLQKDNHTNETIYQNRIHELIYVPPKLDKNTLTMKIVDGVIYIQADSNHS